MIEAHYRKIKEICGQTVRLCIVSKNRAAEEILSYYEEGERCFGENRAGELKAKAKELPDDIRWHFIGHLQRNKVKDVIPVASCLQSLDSLPLARAVSAYCALINKPVDVLCEFHLADEDTAKTGLDPAQAKPFLKEVSALPFITVKGIMVMGPHTSDEKRIKEVFAKAHDLYTTLAATYKTMDTLSMGMSGDYRLAIECGSTMVRIGSYLFEK